MALAGGGCLSDHDVINYSLTPDIIEAFPDILTFYGFSHSGGKLDLPVGPQTGPVCGTCVSCSRHSPACRA